MTTENIIKNIKTALSGEPEKDIEYLTKQLFKYKDSHKEISKEIGVLIYDCLPENEKNIFSHVLYGEDDKNKTLEEAYEMIKNGQLLNAKIILNEEIKNIRKQDNDRNECVYLSLNTFFELCVYTEIYNKDIPVRPTPFEFNLFYKLYGFILFKQEKLDEAKEALENALYWNPVSLPCLLDLAEIYKTENNIEKMYDITKNSLKYAYDRHSISRCYRNLGYYYIEKKDYETAICLYVMANEYEESPKIVNELSRIIAETGKKLKKPSAEEIAKKLKEKNIQIGSNPEIIKIAVGIGNNARDIGEKEAAEYCYNIVFNLTGDINVMKNVKKFKNELRKRQNK